MRTTHPCGQTDRQKQPDRRGRHGGHRQCGKDSAVVRRMSPSGLGCHSAGTDKVGPRTVEQSEGLVEMPNEK